MQRYAAKIILMLMLALSFSPDICEAYGEKGEDTLPLYIETPCYGNDDLIPQSRNECNLYNDHYNTFSNSNDMNCTLPTCLGRVSNRIQQNVISWSRLLMLPCPVHETNISPDKTENKFTADFHPDICPCEPNVFALRKIII